MSILPSSGPSLVRAARRRLPATVALDLRPAGRAAAVAMDAQGELAAWAVVSGGDPVALARRALRELRVRPKQVLVLLGAEEAQVTVLEQAGEPDAGPDAGTIAAALFAEGYERLSEPSVASLPLAPDTWLVAACGPAWRLALHPAAPPLASPRGERRRASLAWARRAARAALVLAACGALLMAAGLRLAWAGLASRTPAARAAEVRLVRELRETGELAGEVERLRSGLAGQRAPWPRLAGLIATLARRLPLEVAWERLHVKDGALELEASAAGRDPFARLQSLRHNLESAPGIANLSWGTPAVDKKSGRLRQVFRAALREMPAAAPRGEP